MKIISSRKFQIIAAVLIIAAVHLYDLPSFYAITIINDEFGYVGMGAQMAGYDWTGMLGTSPYYSYGYGIILSLLFRIGLTGVSFFRTAVVLNVIFLVISFFIACYLAEEIIPCKWNVPIALAVNLYTSNIFQCKLCWAETLLYFLSWVFILLLYQLNKKYEMKYLAGAVVTAVYMYTVHQRCISMIIAAVIMAFLILCNGHREKKSLWKFLGACLLLIVLLFAASQAKQFIIANWYAADSLTDSRIAVNDYAGQVSKLKSFTDLKSLLSMILGMSGKLYAQALASGMLILFALISALQVLAGKVITAVKEKRPLTWEKEEILLLASSLMFLGALGIAAIYKARTLSNQRYYEITMTRYIDYVTGPMLLSGFYVLAHLKKYGKSILTAMAAMAGLTLLTYFQFTKSYYTLFNSVNVASVYHVLKGVNDNLKVILIAGAGVILLSAAFIGMITVGSRRNKKDIGILTAAVCLAGIFVYSGITEEAAFRDNKQQEVVQYVNPVIEYMDEQEWTGTIYYVGTGRDAYNFLKILLFLRPEQEIKLVEESEIEELKKTNPRDLLISATKELEEFTLTAVKENKIMDTGRLCVYTLKE